MNVKETIGSVFWLIVGISVSLGSIKLGIGQVSSPGPGFMTLLAGLIMIALSLFLVVSTIRKKASQIEDSFSLSVSIPFVIVLVSLFVFALVLTTLGYLISIALFMLVMLKLTSKKWLGPIVWSVCVSISTYLIFSVLLKSNFPRGIFNIG
jgi:putative tricarboxylic transport membrane protein